MSVSCHNCLKGLKHNEEIMEFKCESGCFVKTERRIQLHQLRSSEFRTEKDDRGKGGRKRYLYTCDSAVLSGGATPRKCLEDDLLNWIKTSAWAKWSGGGGRGGWYLTRGSAHVCRPPSPTARRKHLTPRAPPTTACLDRGSPARRNSSQQPPPRARGDGGEAAKTRRRTAGELRLTLSPLFCLTAGICLFAGAARLQPSTGKCATSTNRRTAAWGVHEEEKKRGGEKEESVVSLQRNPGAVCLPRRCCCCRARSEISCSPLERRHLFPSAVLHCRFKR